MPFDEDLIYGEYGERIAWISLLESARTRQVLDVRKDKYFQERDIDFLQLDVDNKVNKIEVKTDRQAHKTGNIVFEIQKVGKSLLSPSIRAELYREIGMYAKCFEFESWAGRNMDEREILAEVMFRAAHYESRPFIIEHCDYCRDNTRFKKRTPCPLRT